MNTERVTSTIGEVNNLNYSIGRKRKLEETNDNMYNTSFKRERIYINDELRTHPTIEQTSISTNSTEQHIKTDQDVELRWLQMQNINLKNKILETARNTSLFAKTLLGLDLSSRVGVLLMVDGGRVATWNSPFRTTLGYEEEDLHTCIKTIKDVIDDNDKVRVFNLMVDAVINKLDTFDLTASFKQKDGSTKLAQITAMMSYDSTTRKPTFCVFFISFSTNITTDWDHMQRLQQSQLEHSRIPKHVH
ncbi:hypothetical protein AKO1_014762 [Acrasis kona]|uniref:PAS domain-containing protein n=1 Tax=Acrasis kona TaxID=1008807 RepID=A0AAW2Z246_9EUKA